MIADGQEKGGVDDPIGEVVEGGAEPRALAEQAGQFAVAIIEQVVEKEHSRPQHLHDRRAKSETGGGGKA